MVAVAMTFASKLERMPHYEAGMHEDAAREAFGADDVVKLASNESPWGPHPAVVEGIARAAAGLNRYPDQHAWKLRRRIAERFEVDPARVAVGNGSCEILLAAAEALCEPGDELLFAWPSFSIYPHLAALSGAREIRVPLADGYVLDLDAMLAEVTAATQLVCLCNPNNPTGTHLGIERITEFCERRPGSRHGRPRRGLRRVPDRRRPGRDHRPALGVPEPGGACARSARSTAWPGSVAATRCARPGFRAAIDAVRQPFSVNELAQVAAAEAIVHGDDVASSGSSERSSSGCSSRRASRSSASSRRPRRRTSPGCRSATATRLR